MTRAGSPAAGPVPPATGLAARQAALVDALVAGGPLPAGFDRLRTAATRRALLRKRAGEAAKAWPLLAAERGDGWASTVQSRLDGRPPGGALADGWDVARALRSAGELGRAGAAELAEREAGWSYDGHTQPRRRRLPAVRTTPDAVFVQLAGRIGRWDRARRRVRGSAG